MPTQEELQSRLALLPQEVQEAIAAPVQYVVMALAALKIAQNTQRDNEQEIAEAAVKLNNLLVAKGNALAEVSNALLLRNGLSAQNNFKAEAVQ